MSEAEDRAPAPEPGPADGGVHDVGGDLAIGGDHDVSGDLAIDGVHDLGGDLAAGTSPAGEERSPFRRIGERPRFEGERLSVVTGTFVGPDGFTFEREIVRTFDAVCVVPLEDDREHVLLVRQYRGAVDQPLLELPAGKLDVAGEEPAACAARELAEEVGMEAGRWREVGWWFISPGFCDERSYCFLAEQMVACDRAADGIEEHHMVTERISLRDVEALVASGRLADAKTIAGLLLARSLIAAERPAAPSP